MRDQVQRAILDLFEIGAVQFGKFRLKLHEKNPHAPLSPIYVDLRVIRSFPSVLRDVGGILGGMAAKFQPDFVADVPTAATPIVGLIAASFNIPMLSPRAGVKEHGTKKQIEGTFRPRASVVLVDDLITHAESKVEAIKILRDHDLIVEHVIVLVDREQGGGEELRRHGCRLHSAVTLKAILDIYVSEGRISETSRGEVLEYLESN